jgi:hypothetical protein
VAASIFIMASFLLDDRDRVERQRVSAERPEGDGGSSKPNSGFHLCYSMVINQGLHNITRISPPRVTEGFSLGFIAQSGVMLSHLQNKQIEITQHFNLTNAHVAAVAVSG